MGETGDTPPSTDKPIRVAYGSHWWMLDDDGSVLIYDEDQQVWDLWEGESGDPLPPPEFFGLAPPNQPRMGFLESPKLLTVLVVFFFVSASVYLGLQTYISLLERDLSLVEEPSQTFIDLMYFFTPLARAVWEVSVASLLALMAYNVHRYLRDRRARDEDPRPFVGDEL